MLSTGGDHRLGGVAGRGRGRNDVCKCVLSDETTHLWTKPKRNVLKLEGFARESTVVTQCRQEGKEEGNGDEESPDGFFIANRDATCLLPRIKIIG